MTSLSKTSLQTIKRDIETIDTFNATPGYGTTRILFTEEEIAARDYVKKRMKQTGLEVVEDGVGNIFGLLAGSKRELPPVWTGSHIDTVNNAGRFDGMAGVFAGLEALRVIKESGIQHERDLAVIVFTSEEPTRFGKWGIGSHAMAGLLAREELALLKDESGQSLEQILIDLGFEVDLFDRIRKDKGEVHAFVELHIEQAPILDRKQVPIGVVETICGLTSLQITVAGIQGHAGGTPKNERCDPVMAFSELCLHLESAIYSNDEPYLVGTVGKVVVTPNASNVIPQKVVFSVDIRDRHMHTKDEVLKSLRIFAADLEKKRKVKIEIVINTHESPVNASPEIINEIKIASNELGYEHIPLVSGAFHDAVMVSCFSPIGMIFVPCKDGISHSPDEWADYEDIRKGADVLAHTLLNLANT